MGKIMELGLVEVEQGNGKGLSIDRGSQSVLRTTDLVGCIAILIVGEEQWFLIHSDSNLANGKGAVTLADGIKSLITNINGYYEIGLIGGTSPEALKSKYSIIQEILPNTSLKTVVQDVDSAYLTSDGIMAATKFALAERLKIAPSELVLTSANKSFRP